MKVFHGTSLRRYRNIVFSKCINTTTEDNTHYSLDSDKTATKYGMVCLTDSHIAAVEFGLRCWVDNNIRYEYCEIMPEISVFEFDVDPKEL